MMNHLQILMHIPMMETNLPGNAMKFFSTMIPIVKFDILEEFKFFLIKSFKMENITSKWMFQLELILKLE